MQLYIHFLLNNNGSLVDANLKVSKKEAGKILKESGVEYELRTTLVAYYHSEENIKKMANELAGENLLYLQMFKDCDTCIKSNLEAVPKSQAEEFQKILSKKIKNVVLRGY